LLNSSRRLASLDCRGRQRGGGEQLRTATTTSCTQNQLARGHEVPKHTDLERHFVRALRVPVADAIDIFKLHLLGAAGVLERLGLGILGRALGHRPAKHAISSVRGEAGRLPFLVLPAVRELGLFCFREGGLVVRVGAKAVCSEYSPARETTLTKTIMLSKVSPATHPPAFVRLRLFLGPERDIGRLVDCTGPILWVDAVPHELVHVAGAVRAIRHVEFGPWRASSCWRKAKVPPGMEQGEKVG